MTEKTPDRDRVTVLEGTEVGFSLELPVTGPYNGKVVEDGDAGLTERMPPSATEWTITPEFDPGVHELRMVAVGPSDIPITELANLEADDVADGEGAIGEWTVSVVAPSELATIGPETASTLVENTVGLFTADAVDVDAVERLKSLLDETDVTADGPAESDVQFGDLPEYEILAHVVENNRD